MHLYTPVRFFLLNLFDAEDFTPCRSASLRSANKEQREQALEMETGKIN